MIGVLSFLLSLVLALAGAPATALPANQEQHLDDDYFRQFIRPIFETHCFECHADENGSSGLRLDVKLNAFSGGALFGPAIVPHDLAASPLWKLVSAPEAEPVMPPDGERLNSEQLQALRRWIEAGAPWPDGLDAEVVDRRDHWAFKPVQAYSLPDVRNRAWPKNEIDYFVLQKLEQHGLTPTPEADRRTWLRRVTWDLTGLPPTVDELRNFLRDSDADAYEKVVTRLLESPHYGPRWAQHWLDVVRYADTHGFEVNTERPHAWPYRDYVIQAFQTDLPFDRFVQQQIAGDLEGEDAATGFLLTASVLLPGQIGQDEPSKRLARQDALDEIVTNVAQSFLALSVGCARCHDHRFDAISQQDYYAWQALIAGVEYEDRPWRSAASRNGQRERDLILADYSKIEQELIHLQPLANPSAKHANRPPVQAARNVDRVAPETATGIRFTILQTNQYEPCLDELQVWNESGENIAWQPGIRVVTSGDKVAVGTHERRFVNDGQFGNSSSWMADRESNVWIEYHWDAPQTIHAIVWGRDRTGQYSDRLATDYRIEIRTAEQPESWVLVADHTDRLGTGDAGREGDISPEVFDANSEGTSVRSVLPNEMDQLIAPDNSVEILANHKSISAEGGSSGDQEELLRRLKSLEDELSRVAQVPLVFGGRFRQPDRISLLRRGNPELPMHEVVPATLSIWEPLTLSVEADDATRRQQLARWLTDVQNPLTARVAVNRIWQGHFGTGIVPTPSDFGRNGMPPTHPELLDWLAQRFVADGWSTKALHRQIVLSATYRQSGQFEERASEIDADNRWLWRFPSRRLEAEAIRDGILFVAAELDSEQGGPGFDLFRQRGGLSGFTAIESLADSGKRRMIYAHKIRREREIVFGSFDCPDAGQSTATRRISTTPLQALNLWNSRLIVEVSRNMAVKLEQEAPTLAEQIELAWLRVLNRIPTSDEATLAEKLAQDHGVAEVCRVLFNSNEFLHLP